MTTEAIPAGAFDAARTGIDRRLTWGSLHWPELPPDLLDEITTAALAAAAPITAAQALRDAADEWFGGPRKWLNDRADTIEGKSE